MYVRSDSTTTHEGRVGQVPPVRGPTELIGSQVNEGDTIKHAWSRKQAMMQFACFLPLTLTKPGQFELRVKIARREINKLSQFSKQPLGKSPSPSTRPAHGQTSSSPQLRVFDGWLHGPLFVFIISMGDTWRLGLCD